MKTYNLTKHHESGFTLIELIVATLIIAIIASIGIPGYQRYVVQNAENNAQAEMKQLQIQLDKWRASRLTFAGFIPNLGKDVCASGDIEFCYSTSDNKTIYIPLGSSNTDYKYKLTLVDGRDSNASLVPASISSAVDVSVGQSWKMFAVPNTDGNLSKARKIMLTNTGVQCITSDTSITITSINCGTSSLSSSW